MDLTSWVYGLLILVGIVGILVPVLPGLLLVWAAVLLWAVETSTPAGWAVLGVATALAAGGITVQYLLPGRRLKSLGVPTRTTLAGAALALVGFFVVPVIGLFLGFVLGVYLAERVRLRTHAAAWPSTRHALRAALTSMGIELATALAIAVTWLVGVLSTR